jgi:hypothetical protein
MPLITPRGQPDRYLTYQDVGDRILSAGQDLMEANEAMRSGSRIGVHVRPVRNRYTLNGERVTRSLIDRLVYFGSINEGEL